MKKTSEVYPFLYTYLYFKYTSTCKGTYVKVSCKALQALSTKYVASNQCENHVAHFGPQGFLWNENLKHLKKESRTSTRISKDGVIRLRIVRLSSKSTEHRRHLRAFHQQRVYTSANTVNPPALLLYHPQPAQPAPPATVVTIVITELAINHRDEEEPPPPPRTKTPRGGLLQLLLGPITVPHDRDENDKTINAIERTEDSANAVPTNRSAEKSSRSQSGRDESQCYFSRRGKAVPGCSRNVGNKSTTMATSMSNSNDRVERNNVSVNSVDDVPHLREIHSVLISDTLGWIKFIAIRHG
ncbi:hypothetical protein EAI_04263 [Harpegnathos saltator]|uniref:Uncharacterized protein n=1 Tax=Harpegnathos saltator TaxID=610380 RepID=E2BD59_HARSA|nr:hypothetical protein EAI_04263 [Harpegnathos saltator]